MAKAVELQGLVRFNPLNSGQKEAARLYPTSDVLFMLGDGGSGKTIAMVGLAAEDVAAKNRKRIVYMRPAVECGRSLGSLPGTLEEKLEPYKQPFLQALRKVSYKFPEALCVFQAISYVQGLSFDDSVICVDEAQNCSLDELRTILTRLGKNSKIILSADPYQSYVRPTQWEYETDVEFVASRLEGLEGISIVDFDPNEILRNPLISKMLKRL